jgi:hypothetical protein
VKEEGSVRGRVFVYYCSAVSMCVTKLFALLCLLLQYLIQSCACGGRRIVEDMCYEIRRAESFVD